MKDSKL